MEGVVRERASAVFGLMASVPVPRRKDRAPESDCEGEVISVDRDFSTGSNSRRGDTFFHFQR